jgi:hypothetical protein
LSFGRRRQKQIRIDRRHVNKTVIADQQKNQ